MTSIAPTPDAIAAGIVAFEPDVDLLLRNVSAIKDQVTTVWVYDNGSSNVEAAAEALRPISGVRLVRSGSNDGIAAAFNAVARMARDAGFKWLVTLDQDSVAPAGMVAALASKAKPGTPLIAPHIVDRNKTTVAAVQATALPPVEYFSRAASKGAITSGALLDLGVLEEVGGFDETFFIDYVDYDLNMRLMRAGYKIARANDTHLSHAVGEARQTWLFTPRRGVDGRWRIERFYAFGHSPTRCYYKARNRVLYSRKHWRSVGLRNEGIVQIPQQIALTLLFEDQKIAKLRAFARGTYEGFRAPLDNGRQARKA
ncbi:glycosyltransferase [Nocardioides cavernae]|uniref:Glycosyltransferase n=1 Tax=Nocardioides cavernae TaxID=1921566 RepID=A0ABR8N5K5_9ACTN|nr:glycosyltransferase [Nocardioides cavernae]MBD3923448.1 glycosyltransferase [Nocardioides cavernae]MBM7511627.1 rhamnosyltransferase [Nocardioides cavernae]